MLHFLFTDPETGNGQPFLDMMTDFVRLNRDKAATTDDFFFVANQRLKDTPLAQKYHYKDLNWFYRQWVTETYLPSYEFTYHLDQDAQGVVVKGDLVQSGIPDKENWFMPLPLVMHFPGNKIARGTIAVLGNHTPITFRLPQRPDKIELDPDLWILYEKTNIVKQ